MKENHRDNLTKLAIAFFVIIPAITAIIYMKSSVAEQRDGMQSDNHTLSSHKPGMQVAVPDTTVSPEERPLVAAGEQTTATDSLATMRDLRPADEAGAEDGYWDGYYDGAEGTGHHERYDEHSNFTSKNARRVYAENYAEGYQIGFAEGSSAGGK